jgi:hypothetical protein
MTAASKDHHPDTSITETVTKSEHQKAAPSERSKTTLFIRNIPFTTTTQVLFLDFWSKALIGFLGS